MSFHLFSAALIIGYCCLDHACQTAPASIRSWMHCSPWMGCGRGRDGIAGSLTVKVISLAAKSSWSWSYRFFLFTFLFYALFLSACSYFDGSDLIPHGVLLEQA